MQKFAENCMKMKDFGRGRGAYVLGSATDYRCSRHANCEGEGIRLVGGGRSWAVLRGEGATFLLNNQEIVNLSSGLREWLI